MKIISTLFCLSILCSCTSIPDVGLVEIPVNDGENPVGSIILGRGTIPAPCTVVGFKTLPGGSPIGNRVEIQSNDDEVRFKIFDQPLQN